MENALLWLRTETGAFAIGMVGSLLIAAFAYHRHFTFAQGFRHRIVNWMVVALIGIAVALVCLVHIVNLAGLETGRR